MTKILATNIDLNAIDEALQIVFKPQLDFIFKDRSKLSKVLVVTLDSENIYYWKYVDSGFKLYRSKINFELSDVSHHWWACGPFVKGLDKLLPKEILDPEGSSVFISGGLLTPFIEEQQKRNLNNPYCYKEGYLATIIHEFGHAYFNQFKSTNYLIRANNLKLIEYTKDLYNRHKLTSSLQLDLISNPIWSEVFAFCTDYSASKIFWEVHFERICKENVKILSKVLAEEETRDVYWDLSPLSRPHIAALIMGPILCENNPTDWPSILLK